MEIAITLEAPSLEALPQYAEALRRGWSPNRAGGDDMAREQLEAIEKDPAAFVARQVDPDAKGPPVKLPDGTLVPRLPGYVLWIWDGAFSGIIGLRWQRGSDELPAHVLGHIGYSVVPWKRDRGYARRALALMLERARGEGLGSVQLTTDPDNVASQRVIEANGGVLVERFTKTAHYGGTPGLRYRIALAR
ncbi:MAG TPA: GNAT family N-acetyltransferase [Usitatibacter sp.]|nr:GNAT family N-acetyltransferase [Usitatibacter sp.]